MSRSSSEYPEKQTNNNFQELLENRHTEVAAPHHPKKIKLLTLLVCQKQPSQQTLLNMISENMAGYSRMRQGSSLSTTSGLLTMPLFRTCRRPSVLSAATIIMEFSSRSESTCHKHLAWNWWPAEFDKSEITFASTTQREYIESTMTLLFHLRAGAPAIRCLNSSTSVGPEVKDCQ